MSLKFITTPENQGQIVEVSYAVDSDHGGEDRIIERCHDRSDGEVTYRRYVDPEFFEEDSANLEFWNGSPKLGECTDKWKEAQ
jgi:hypothetical protein